MADRDLNTSDQAFGAVLASLQREVRLLRSRAARPGAVRYDIKDPMSPALTSQSNNVRLTLNEMRLDPGMWALFARGEANIAAASFTGEEAINAEIGVLEPSWTSLATGVHTPMTTPSTAGVGVFTATWSLFAVHHADDAFTVLHEGWSGDWLGNTHTVTWNRAALMALPM